MKVSNSNRWFLFSGIIFVILWLYVSIPKGELGFLAEPEAVVAFYADNSALFWWHGYLGVLSGVFLMLFVGSVYGVLKDAGPKVGVTANLAFGGGIAAGAVAIAGFALQLGLSERAGNAAGIAPAAAVAMSDIIGGLTGVALPIPFAVFVGAMGLAFLRTKLLPAWFGWVSVVLAFGLVSPVMYLIMGAGLLWTIVVSLWLFARVERLPRPVVDEAATARPV